MVAARMVVATTAFAVMVKGVEVLVRAGDEYPARSAVVKGREHLFTSATETRPVAGAK